jgi:membrane protease YdiL (CAAX protease family)
VWNAAQICALALIARLAHWPPGEYLGIVHPRGRDVWVALLCLAVFLSLWDGLTYALGRDIVTPFQIASYESARASGSLPLLLFTFVIAAPAGEEIMFRGFLYRGWVRSPGGIIPAIAAISALWTILHAEYDWFGWVQIFLMGLLLGWMRWQSGSVVLTMLMHGIANLWATLETVARMRWVS